jgi:hypothetical protein
MRHPILFTAIATVSLWAGAGSAWSQQPIGAPGSFPLHEENGGATLIERSGLGSPSARMVGEFTRADIKEMCERIGWKFYSPSFPFHGTLQDRQTISICRAKEEARPIEERRYEVRANCPQGLLWNDMGYTFRRVGSDWQTTGGRSVSAEFSPGYSRVVTRQFDMLCGSTQYVAEGPGSSGQAQYAVESSGGAARTRSAPGTPDLRAFADESVQSRLVADAQVRTW